MADPKVEKGATGSKHRFRLRTAKLVRVELLDGAKDKFLAADADQYLNLDKQNKWTDGSHIKNVDRLGHKPRIYVEFDMPGSSEVKLKLVGDGGNTDYTDAEKTRNGRFAHTTDEKTYQTDADGTLVVNDMTLGGAGMNMFYVQGTDTKGNSDNTPILTNMRRTYIQELKMAGDVGANTAADINTVIAEYKKHGYELIALPRKDMIAMENIGAHDTDAFERNVRAAYAASDGKKKEPHTLVIGYTGHLAVKTEGRQLIKAGVTPGPGKAAVDITIAGPGKTNPAVSRKYLWKNIVTGEGWFEGAYFQQKNGLRGFFGWKDRIPEALCVAVPRNAGTPDKCDRVRIDVSRMSARSEGKIVLTVTWVDRMRAGLSFGGNSLICICTRAWWRTKNGASQNEVIVHEMGHKIGMVPGGSGSLPDKPPTFYDSSKGHVGTHCHHGIPAGQARYDSSADSSASDCVMYGSTNGASAFCEHCAVSAKKQVVDNGWPTV
ncbi:MAG: hypothetical protein O3A63_12955 [Proteobacteria bacterium]|nr:hypothetical protein [Pseudomonadota bacterium]